jgi:RNA polymerase sigma-70 factor (ECF subfamily)
MVTRQALNRLRSVSRRREAYVGVWLPEPLLTSPDVAEDAELAENVSIAMLTVLETLGPVERAVFVLREVFETPYHEIAEVVGKTPAAVRQIAHRAREHVAARRPRMQVDRAQQQAAVEKFMVAISTGDVQGLVDVLAPDVVLIPDGGGLPGAARKPITGVEKVVALLARAAAVSDLVATAAWLNGRPGARIDRGGAATAVSLVVEDGRIARIYAISNPDKLGWLEKVVELRR